MRDILCKIFSFIKYILFVIAFGLVFYSIIKTYGRLEKPLSDAIFVFIPFAFVLITFLISLISRSRYVAKSLLFNLVAVFLFVVTIIICLRSMFDTNMVLFYRYGIDYNPAFLSDNLSAIQAMLYMVGGANVILLLCSLIDRKDAKQIGHEKDMKKGLKKGEKNAPLKEKTEEDNEKENKDKKETNID